MSDLKMARWKVNLWEKLTVIRSGFLSEIETATL